MAGRYWTKEENDSLERLWPRAPWDEICEALPRRSRSAIGKRAADLEFRRSPTANSKPRNGIHPMFKTLRAARDARNMTRQELAAQIGYHHVQIARWELGDDSPTLFGLLCWCEALGLTIALVSTKPLEPVPNRKPPGMIKPSLARMMAGR